MERNVRRRSCPVQDAEITDDDGSPPPPEMDKSYSPATGASPSKECEVSRSRSWHAASNQRKPDVAKRISHPEFSSREGDADSDLLINQEQAVAKKCTGGPIHCFIRTITDFSSAIMQYGWDCGHALLQQLNSLVSAAYSFLQANNVSPKVENSEMSEEEGEVDNRETIGVMEAQTKTLLEINKFLREEVCTIKEEREVAEEMVKKIEEKCREAIENKRDMINALELFELLYGSGSAREFRSTTPDLPMRSPSADEKFKLTDDVALSRPEGTLIISDVISVSRSNSASRSASEVASENLFECPPEKRQKRDPSV